MRKGGNDLLECPEGWISDLLPVLRLANDALQYVLGRRRLVQLGRAGPGICYRMVERLWKDLTDVPFQEDEDGRLILEKEYVMKCGTRVIKTLPAGTDREEIWHWFDEMHPKGVAYLLNGEEKNGGKHNGRSEWIFAGGSPGRC